MLRGILELDSQVPDWLRPTYRGAVFILGMAFGWAGALFVAAILALLILMLGGEQGLLLFGGLLAVAVISGAVSGTLYGMLQPLQRGGPLGSWLRWAVAIFGYFASFVLLTPKGPFTLREPTFYPLAAAVAALAALAMVLLDDRGLDRPSPRQFALQQSRKRLWTTARLRRARARRTPVTQS
jgi:hypothetical protein